MIYIDNYWLTPVERVRVLDDVQGFVEALAPEGLRFLVVTHDPGITLRTTVTRDASEVLGALEALHEEPARGLDAYRDRERVFSGPPVEVPGITRWQCGKCTRPVPSARIPVVVVGAR